MSAAEREARLLGAGLPLPDAFSAVLAALLDGDDLIFYYELAPVLQARMKSKERRILAQWPGWEDFARDILAQLDHAGLVDSDDGWYGLAPDFVPGQRYTVLPDVQVTAWGRAERMAREASELLRGELRRLQSPRYAAADPGALKLVSEAITALDIAMHATRPLGRPARPGRPSAKDLAREKYGYDGGVPIPRAKVFGADGTRPCKQCRKDTDPDGFNVYIDNGKWYLHPTCNTCRNEERRLAR